jgi:hypothetical protein
MIRCIYIKKSKMHYRSLNFSWYVILVYELSKYVIVISKLSLGLWSARKWFYNIELLLNIYNWNPIYFVNWFFILPLLDRFNLPRFISPGVVALLPYAWRTQARWISAGPAIGGTTPTWLHSIVTTNTQNSRTVATRMACLPVAVATRTVCRRRPGSSHDRSSNSSPAALDGRWPGACDPLS